MARLGRSQPFPPKFRNRFVYSAPAGGSFLPFWAANSSLLMFGLRKNVASQVITFDLVNATTGAALTGATVTTKATLDGTQGAGAGTVTELGTGQYKYVPTQGETNGTTAGFSFTATNAVPVNIHCFITAADPTDSVRLGLTGIPNAVPGAAGGLFIAGSNAATTISGLTTGALSCTTITASGAVAFQSTFAVTTSTALGAISGTTLTLSGAVAFQSTFAITGTTTHTGNVVLSDGLTISAPSTGNRAGLSITGNGTGAGILATGGATGIGFSIVGGGTSGDGLKVVTTSGHGINLAPVGTNMHGFLATGGNGGTSDGFKAVAGTGGVPIRGAITGDITGNLSGSVGSVTGAVGSVTGAVGSVTGNVGGNVSGNVTGSIGSLGAQAKLDVNAEADTAASDYGALKPTTAGRTLDVNLQGNAGIDWANIDAPTTTVNFSGSTIGVVTAAAVSSIGANVVNASALATDAVTEIQSGLATSSALSTLQTDVTTLLGRITSTLFSGMTSLAQWLGLIAGKQTGNTTARTELRATGGGSGTFDETTDSLEAVRDSALTAAQVWANGTRTLTALTGLVPANFTDLTIIAGTGRVVVDNTDDITEAITGSLPFSTLVSNVNDLVSQVGDANTTLGLLLTTSDALFTTLEDDGAGGQQFTALALENAPTGTGGGGGTDWDATERQQIRHRLGIDGSASAPSATPSLSTLTAAGVWANGARTLTSLAGLVPANFTSFSISVGGLVSVNPAATAFNGITPNAAFFTNAPGGGSGSLTTDQDEKLTAIYDSTRDGVTVVSSVIRGGNYELRSGDTWAITVRNLRDLTTVATLRFTLKAEESDTDAEALVMVELAAGLVTLNGAAAATSGDASITILDDVAGHITVNVAKAATAQVRAQSAKWGVKVITDAGAARTSKGTALITESIIDAIS